jgi:hypothetical protein
MPVLICPECGADNPPEAEKCWICMASLEGITPADAVQDDSTLLPHAEDDLTDLLNSLKLDDDLGQISAENGEDLTSSLEADAEMESPQGEDEEPELPEWLNRIRHRAQTEPDSVGEITQKISAAKESLDAEKNEQQQRQFEDLLHKIHGEEDQPPADEAAEIDNDDPAVTTEPVTVRGDWLKRIRKKHRPAEAEKPEEILSEREGDSLLQWLVALEDGDEAAADHEADQISDSAIQAEITKEVILEPGTDEETREIPLEDVRISQGKALELTISREDQARADQLSAMIMDENSSRPERIPEKSVLPRGLRLAIGFVLITILSLALFLGTPGEMPPTSPSSQSLGVVEWVQGLPEGSSLLVVLDYPAAYSAEMAIIAPPILREIHSSGAAVSILSSAPAGSLLFERLLVDADLDGQWVAQDLGYYPVGSFGAYGLAHQVSPSQSQPEFSIGFPAGPFEGVLILGDDYEGGMAWIEQFSSLSPDTPILLLVSAQAGPLLQPYWESGQVTGIISGFSDAVELTEQPAGLANRWRAYQVGTVLMILMLLIGMSFPAPQSQISDGQDER